MKILDVAQGTPEWHAARAQHFCASEASAMMGASKYQTRNDLLKLKSTGIGQEVDEHKQRLFDRGHDAEASIRPHIESIIGAELYPAVGIEGELLASFDGVTMGEDTIFEHKLWSEDLAAAVRAGDLDPHYYWQLEHQLAVSGAEKAIFVVSDGTPERCLHMIYTAQPQRRSALIAGWKQFAYDLAEYQPTVEAVPVLATPTEALPAVSVRMDGAIAVISNLDVFGERLKAFIANIDQNPSTDQAFADAEAAVKTLEKAQDALEQAEAAALAQTSSIDEMRRTVALYKEMARTTRLTLEKIVKARKDTIRIEIKREAELKLLEHVSAINKRLGKVQLPPIAADFAAPMKGKKTIASIRSAVDAELARAKIEASTVGDRIGINLASLRELAAEHAFLFADAQQIVLKANDDLVALIKTRIAEHQAAEQKRLDAERERIRKEEEAKAQREAEAKVEQDRQRIRDEERQKAQQEATTIKRDLGNVQPAASAPTAAEAATDGTVRSAGIGAARLKLGDINARIAPLSISADGLAELGFHPVGTEKSTKLYAASTYPAIVRALVERLNNSTMKVAA